jgi:hypothetical protein
MSVCPKHDSPSFRTDEGTEIDVIEERAKHESQISVNREPVSNMKTPTRAPTKHGAAITSSERAMHIVSITQ